MSEFSFSFVVSKGFLFLFYLDKLLMIFFLKIINWSSFSKYLVGTLIIAQSLENFSHR